MSPAVCALATIEPGSATLLNRCNITEVASANASAAASLATVVAPNITFGGEFGAGGAIEHGLVGALEEIFISRVDTRKWTRYNWNVPPTGITNFFSTQHCLQHLCASQCLTRSSLSLSLRAVWDYTVPAVREFWADSLATLCESRRWTLLSVSQTFVVVCR